MKLPERWLRSYCNPPIDGRELAHRLTMAGLEVETETPVGTSPSRVVLARIVSARRHPDADRLQVCEVDAGEGTLRTIVCGAPNAREGLWTACALPGAVLPGGMTIGVAKMRGVESAGMLCSARELGLGQGDAGIMELDDVVAGEKALAPGTPLSDALALDETVFELKLTPNLAHAMSVTGVARELSAMTGAPFTVRPLRRPEVSIDDRLPVTIEAPDLCGRFSGRIVRGVDAKARTPRWMRERLERAGQRSISALVDISNYVMLELGRPSHVFDLGRIDGGLVVRWGREGETLKLLNGQTVDVGPRDGQPVGVIADATRVESLAGIMGGDHAAVSDDTRDIYIEMAFWWPAAVAGRARRYRFSTDAAQRFERGVDGSTTIDHLDDMTALVLEVCGGRAGPVDDHFVRIPERPSVTLRLDRLRRIAGMDFDRDEVAGLLDRLGLEPVASGDEAITVTPPAGRFDVAIEEDLIEEVLRIRGYDQIPVRAPRQRAAMRAVPERTIGWPAIRRRWAARGYQELVNFSFLASADDARFGDGTKAIRLVNPIAENLDVMRTGLWAGMVATLERNINRQAERMRAFELGRVFLPADDQPAGPLALAGIAQPMRLGLLAWGPAEPEQWGAAAREVDFHDLKGDLEDVHPEVTFRFVAATHPALHPGQSARIIVDGEPVGWIGAVHPKWLEAIGIGSSVFVTEIDAATLNRRALPQAAVVSRFPAVVRDAAWIVGEHQAAGEFIGAIEQFVRDDVQTRAVRQVGLFDQYQGKGLAAGEKSLAVRFRLQKADGTLEDAEVDTAMRAIIAFAEQRFGARLRA